MDEYSVNTPSLILAGLLGTILTVAAILGLQVVYYQYTASLEASQGPGQPQAEMEALRDRQQAVLADYGVIDPEKGVVAIPIDRAMELVVNDLAQPNTPPKIEEGRDEP